MYILFLNDLINSYFLSFDVFIFIVLERVQVYELLRFDADLIGVAGDVVVILVVSFFF